jgi:hypothetical protein
MLNPTWLSKAEIYLCNNVCYTLSYLWWLTGNAAVQGCRWSLLVALWTIQIAIYYAYMQLKINKLQFLKIVLFHLKIELVVKGDQMNPISNL